MKKRKNGEFVSLTFVSVKTERLVDLLNRLILSDLLHLNTLESGSQQSGLRSPLGGAHQCYSCFNETLLLLSQ